MIKKEVYEFIRKFKEDHKPDQKAQEAVWLHGCNKKSIKKIKDALESNARIGELCCSRPEDPETFRGYGLLIKGKVTAMFAADCFSDYDPFTYVRYIDPDDESDLSLVVDRYDDLYPLGCGYTESWVIPKEIIGTFIRRSYLEEEDVVRFLESIGLPITIIEEADD